MAITLFKSKITFYETPQQMPLWNLLEYLKTKDLRYFTKEFKHHKDLDNIMTDFYGHYLKLTKNNSIINRFGVIHNILKYTTKYNTVSLILKALYNFPKEGDIKQFEMLIDALEKWNYRIDRRKDVFKQLEDISNRIQGIKTKIAIYEAELEEEDKGEVSSIESQLITVGRILELKYRIEPKEITVADWVEYQKQAEESVKRQNKGK